MLPLANVANQHFFALTKLAEDVAAPASAGVEGNAWLQMAVGRQTLDTGDSDSEFTAVQPYEGGMLGTEQDVHQLAALCHHLSKWLPFEPPANDGDTLPTIVKALEVAPDDLKSTTGQVMQWREGVKLWQWESQEAAMGISREDQYQAARTHYLAAPHQGRKRFAQSRKLAMKLSMAHIAKALEKPCEKGRRPHTCLDQWRAIPLLALRWRKLWYSLPKADRVERLRDMFARGLAAQEDAQNVEDHMQFQVLGQPCCRQAFIAITGIHAETLQSARRCRSLLACRAYVFNVHSLACCCILPCMMNDTTIASCCFTSFQVNDTKHATWDRNSSVANVASKSKPVALITPCHHANTVVEWPSSLKLRHVTLVSRMHWLGRQCTPAHATPTMHTWIHI